MMGKIARRVLIGAVVVGAWQLLRSFDLVSGIILASPSEIYAAIRDSGWEFLGAFWLTFVEIMAALAIAWAAGVVLGLLIGSVRYAAAVFGRVFSAFFAVPLITWYPLLLIWLGLDSKSKIAYGAISGFFPVVLNTIYAVRQVDLQFIRFGRSIGCSRSRILVQILAPLVLPSILTGLRIGSALVVIGVIVTEMLSSLGGLGFWISYHRNLYNTGHVYLGILLSLCCVLLVNVALSRLERRFGAWRVAEIEGH